MNKKIPIILFIFLAALGSFFLVTYVESAKVTDFIVQQRENIEGGTHRLLLATAIANRNDGSDAFIEKNTVLFSTFNEPTINGNVSIYALTLFSVNSHSNVLAIFLDEITIQDDLALIDDNNQHIFQVLLTFNQSIQLGSTNKHESLETFVTLYSDSQKLILIEIDSLLTNYPDLAITNLTFSFPLQNELSYSFLSISFAEEEQLSLNQFDIFEKYQTTYLTNDLVIYDPTLLTGLQSLNHYYLSHFSVYILLVGTVTYWFFFRKKPWNKF